MSPKVASLVTGKTCFLTVLPTCEKDAKRRRVMLVLSIPTENGEIFLILTPALWVELFLETVQNLDSSWIFPTCPLQTPVKIVLPLLLWCYTQPWTMGWVLPKSPCVKILVSRVELLEMLEDLISRALCENLRLWEAYTWKGLGNSTCPVSPSDSWFKVCSFCSFMNSNYILLSSDTLTRTDWI
jgi:hypothetical protein